MKQTKEHLEKRLAKHRQAMLHRKEESRRNGSDSICTSCGRLVDKSEFSKDPRYLHGYRRRCKKCKVIQSRKSNIKKVFGITESEYMHRIVSAGACESCGGTKRLVLDHCHKTNKVRGVMCSNCNTALGLLGDNPEKIEYLLKYILSYS